MAFSPQNTDDGCPNCGSPEDWGAASWCPNCGYYPAAGALVDPHSDDHEGQVHDHWWQVVPGWSWGFALGIVLIFAGSIGVRLYFDDSPIRGLWALGQLGLGTIVFVVAHVIAYMYACCHDAKLGPLDIVIKPWETWKPAFRALPDTERLVCSGAWSLFAAMLAVSVIGGLDYEQIFIPSQQFLQKHRANLLQRTVSSAQKMARKSPELDMDLEEALNDFADKGAVGVNQWATETAAGLTGTPGTEEAGELTGENRPLMECLVFGFTTNEDGELRSLLLAALVTPTRLQFVSKLSVDAVPEEMLQEMARQFPQLQSRKRLVPCPYNGRWIKPQVYCTVAYEGWTIQGLLREPEVIPPKALIKSGLPSIVEQPPVLDDAALSTLEAGIN